MEQVKVVGTEPAIKLAQMRTPEHEEPQPVLVPCFLDPSTGKICEFPLAGQEAAGFFEMVRGAEEQWKAKGLTIATMMPPEEQLKAAAAMGRGGS